MVINDLESQAKLLESDLDSRQKQELKDLQKKHTAERTQKNRDVSALNLLKNYVSALLTERRFSEKKAAEQEAKKEKILKANNEDRIYKKTTKKFLPEGDFMRLVYLSEQMLFEFKSEKEG